MPELELNNGHTLLFDEADVELIGQHTWTAVKNRQTLYAQSEVQVDGRRKGVYLHRLLVDAPSAMQVDHKNGNGLDDRRSNLRLATRSQNQANRGPTAASTTGYKGVGQKPNGKYFAAVNFGGKYFRLGCYHDPWEAAQVYNAKALELWGEFAYLNTPIQNNE